MRDAGALATAHAIHAVFNIESEPGRSIRLPSRRADKASAAVNTIMAYRWRAVFISAGRRLARQTAASGRLLHLRDIV
jgi:hypothetical protein